MWLLFALLAVSLWAIDNVLSSIMVKHYEKNEITLSWVVSVLDMIFLLPILIFFFWPQLIIDPYWIIRFFLAGAFSYIGWILFYYVLKHIDASVTNVAWAMLAIFVSIGGVVFFHETWSLSQTMGVFLALSGVFILSYWHKHVSVIRTLALLSLLGFTNAPYFLVQKAAMLSDINVFAAFFYPFASASVIAFVFPLCTKRRNAVFARCKNLDFWYLFICFLIVTISAVGFYCMAKAYSLGSASIVVMAENIQPFIVMFFAWFAARLVPKYAPRELLTTQSIYVKLTTFVMVFVGLGLLSVG
jgi:drug/metabolite transporter (DMT)-like permease